MFADKSQLGESSDQKKKKKKKKKVMSNGKIGQFFAGWGGDPQSRSEKKKNK